MKNQGKAVRWPESGVLTRLQYAKHPHEKVWYAMTPNGLLANLKHHTVTEHDDGTITVQPSIEVGAGTGRRSQYWHGFLEAGVWREA